MSWHFGDQMGFVFEVHAAAHHFLVCADDVGHGKVQNRARVIEFRLLGTSEHEPDTAAVEEGQASSGKQQRQSEDVPVKCGSTIDVVGVDGDLSQAGDRDGRGCSGHVVTSGAFYSSLYSFFVVGRWPLANTRPLPCDSV